MLVTPRGQRIKLKRLRIISVLPVIYIHKTSLLKLFSIIPALVRDHYNPFYWQKIK